MASQFFARQIHEISGDRVLRWYGAALALVNVLTAIYWLIGMPVAGILDPRFPAVCWPFFESCRFAHNFGSGAVMAVTVSLMVLALVNAILFLRAHCASAYWLLAGLTILKAALLLTDFRLILNQHYMANWVVLAYLFWPAKRQTLQHLLVLFYVTAGMLKISPEWISGAGLYGRRPLGLPASLIPASCVYVLCLELGGVWGLLSRRAWLFWCAIAQLVLFHISSFWVVGFFYPILMFLLLTIFPLTRQWPEPKRWWDLRSPAPFLAMFVALQFVPALFPGDSSITGEGRMFALHMFDAPLECRASLSPSDEQGERRIALRPPPLTNVRIVCDPIVYLSLAREICRGVEMGLSRDFDLRLESRRYGAARFDTIVDIRSFCAARPTYAIWRHNDWIHPPGG